MVDGWSTKKTRENEKRREQEMWERVRDCLKPPEYYELYQQLELLSCNIVGFVLLLLLCLCIDGYKLYYCVALMVLFR